jgi:hypothetical protein
MGLKNRIRMGGTLETSQQYILSKDSLSIKLWADGG